MSLWRGPGRGRAFLRFLLALVWLAIAYFLADKAAHGFSHGAFFPLIRNVFEIFLFILGFSYMEIAWEDAREPLTAIGLPRRRGAAGEFALGAAIGWGIIAVVFLVLVLAATFYVQLSNSADAWGHLVLELFVLAAGSLAAEIAFRGYPFQKLIQTTGPFAAVILAAIFFGVLRLETPGSTAAAAWISTMAAVLLSIGYLRTGALWLPWGLHFAWVASVGILFGQPLAGSRAASSVVRSYIDGPTWLTGSEYGPEASLITLLMLWVGLVVLVRVTRRAAAAYAQPEWRPAGAVIYSHPSVPMPLAPEPPAPPAPVASSEPHPERIAVIEPLAAPAETAPAETAPTETAPLEPSDPTGGTQR